MADPKKGLAVRWSVTQPISKDEGIRLLAELAQSCTKRQRKLREKACEKLRTWLESLPDEGCSVGGNQSFEVWPPNKSARSARIDLEINAGSAFTGQLTQGAATC